MLRQANDQLERTMTEKQNLEESIKLGNEETTAKVWPCISALLFLTRSVVIGKTRLPYHQRIAQVQWNSFMCMAFLCMVYLSALPLRSLWREGRLKHCRSFYHNPIRRTAQCEDNPEQNWGVGQQMVNPTPDRRASGPV